MRVRAINAVSGIHGKERVQMIQDFQSHQQRMQSLLEVPPPKRPLADHVYISPTEAARVLNQESFSEEFLQDNSSSSSIMATNREVNLLAQPDAISQEMIQDLQSSMSQSGQDPNDIALPEQKLSVASSRIDQLNDTESLPLDRPSIYQPEPPSENILQQTGALPKPLPPQSIPTSNEEPILAVPNDQIFAPNRKNALPGVQLPGDISYVHDQRELETLDRLQAVQLRLQENHEERELTFRHPEETLEKAKIPITSIDQPVKYLGETETGILAVEEPENLMAPEMRSPIKELREQLDQSATSDIVLSLTATLL